MYAIIQTGGKQYRVKKDQIIDVELLEGELGNEWRIEVGRRGCGLESESWPWR